jgi:COP9 signalosome complex subunit 4
VCYARILDAKRKFLEAATRYYQLSQLTTRTFGELSVSEEDMITSLTMAVTCAVLAPAGPQRSRMLGTLYKDERSHSLPNFPMLEKMFMERLLRKDEVEAFSASLSTHQKATLEDGVETVLDRAVIEHNMLATSKLYANVTFDQLGLLLGIDAAKAERIAASMLAEKRLVGSIDQPESRIHFEHRQGDEGGTDSAEALRAFDAQIEHICRTVEVVSNAIVAQHPELATKG